MRWAKRYINHHRTLSIYSYFGFLYWLIFIYFRCCFFVGARFKYFSKLYFLPCCYWKLMVRTFRPAWCMVGQTVWVCVQGKRVYIMEKLNLQNYIFVQIDYTLLIPKTLFRSNAPEITFFLPIRSSADKHILLFRSNTSDIRVFPIISLYLIDWQPGSIDIVSHAERRNIHSLITSTQEVDNIVNPCLG